MENLEILANDMKKLVENIENCYKGKQSDDEKIVKAEKQLNLQFSDSYKMYLKEYGSLSFYGTELTGITGTKYDDVINVTERLRKLDEKLPIEYYVVEDLNSDGMYILSNKSDEIFEYINGHIYKKYDSFLEYIKTCKNRK